MTVPKDHTVSTLAARPSAFLDSEATRERALTRLAAHVEAGHVTGGSLLWEGERGSVAGCLIDSADPAEWETRLGLARWMAFALDTVAGRLSPKAALSETQALLSAVPLGANTVQLGSTVMARLLEDIAAVRAPDGALAAVLSNLLALHRRAEADDAIAPSTWRALRHAAVAATDALGPAPVDGERLPLEIAQRRGVGLAIEAAAWDPRRSPTAVSELLRQWLALESLKSDEAFGWTDQDDALIRKTLAEMHARYIEDRPEEKRTVFDFLELHHADMATRLRAYIKHGSDHGAVCAARACALLRQILQLPSPQPDTRIAA
ncbi:hypothetical protein [Roseateles sp.]|uniref:hypothetical protein n=1 Tax=Roseateles sp. TaxID=1971397 RepID=UPI0039E99A49